MGLYRWKLHQGGDQKRPMVRGRKDHSIKCSTDRESSKTGKGSGSLDLRNARM